MDQFRQVGEVLGGIKALMVLKHDISINQRQCGLLLQIFDLAFKTISEEIRKNLRLEDRNTKWKSLENPLRELQRIFKEGEAYIRYCLDIKDWWGKALSLHQNKDCVEFHIHNLLCCFTIVIEAIETAGEISGSDTDDMQKRRLILMKKYDGEWNDPKIFQWKYGKQYLVPTEICNLLGSVCREDRWVLIEKIREKINSASHTMTKHEQKLAHLLIKKLNNGLEPLKGKLLPPWILIGAKDYHVKRRLGPGGSHYKEIHWLGESFALRNFFGEINEQLQDEISLVLSLSHPNIMQYLCGFYDEERKEGFLVMELMNKGLASHIKENSGQRKRIPFSLPVAVDIMLQIARGMEYLHSQKIYHGDLKPSKILLKARNSSPEGYFCAKVTGFGLTSIKSYTSRNHSNQNGEDPVIWNAPEVLSEQEQQGGKISSKYTEKADVYSFGMLCFEILTGKTPFEEGHLQEDKMGRNIRAGERPLFPFNSPKYLVNLTRKCWQAEPTQRPSFAAICRILRYIKKCLVINPDHGQPESPPPLVDYCEIESGYSKLFPSDGSPCMSPVSQIPFQMFGYRLVEKDKTNGGFKDKIWDLGIEGPSIWRAASVFGDENGGLTGFDQRSVCSDVHERKNLSRFGADQRSVCSETPWWRVPSKTAADQLSFRSEFLWRKTDQRSVGSLTPDRNFFTTVAADHRSIASEIPERKTSIGNQTSGTSETLEGEILSKTEADQISGPLETAEKKTLPATAATDEKPVVSENEEKKPAPITATNQNSVGSKITKRTTFPTKAADQNCSETQRKKILSRTASDSVGSKMPERKFLPPIASDSDYSSICSASPEKKKLPKKSSDERSVRSEIPDRKGLAKKNVIVAKSSKGPGTQKGNSPRSSPIWTPKGHSPGSSPTRTPKGNSPRSSPIRTPRGHSPRSSPLNPCARCTRMNRECRAPSVMSPSRRQRNQVSDSETV